MTITNKQVCEQCGAPSARIYAYWPATLCQECAAARVANEKAAEAAQDTTAVDPADEPPPADESPAATADAANSEQPPVGESSCDSLAADQQDPTPADQDPPADTRSISTIGRARRRKNKTARRQAMRAAAEQWASEHDDQLPLQLGLCGRLMRQGDVLGARQLAIAAMAGWVNARFSRLKGAVPSMPVDAVLAGLRAAGDLNGEQFCVLVDAWRLLTAPVDHANLQGTTGHVGTATAQLMRIVLDSPRGHVHLVRKMKTRARSRAGEVLREFHELPLAGPFEFEPETELQIGWPEAAAEDESPQAAEVTA